jgi:hypothetical protein
MPKAIRKPSYLLHKPSGQARVIIDGKTQYLGVYGSLESRERYDDLIAAWLTRQDSFCKSASLEEITSHGFVFLAGIKRRALNRCGSRFGGGGGGARRRSVVGTCSAGRP